MIQFFKFHVVATRDLLKFIEAAKIQAFDRFKKAGLRNSLENG